MRFLAILDKLKLQYKQDMNTRANGTILLAPGSVPRCRHMLFKPLDDQLIDDFLVSQCVHKFPEEYIKFLKYSNGANLFNVKMWHNIKNKKIPTAAGLFTIYGLPRTPPYERPKEMEEPYDMRIEDLGRHVNVPKTWLKCGNYTRNYDFHTETDIFIDTESGKVFSCVRNQNEIVDSWDNLDECFCGIYYSFEDIQEEYQFVRRDQ